MKLMTNTLELVALVAQALKAYVAAMADGHIDLADVGPLLSVWPKLLPAIQGIGQVPKELSELTAEGRAEFMETVRKAIDFNGDEAALEAFSEDLLSWLNESFALLLAGRALFSGKK